MHKSRQNYYSRRSTQTPRPKEAPRGQEEQVQPPGKPEKWQEAKDSLHHPEAKVQRGQAGEREAKRRREREREREQHTHSSRVNRGSGNPRRRRDTHTHPGTI